MKYLLLPLILALPLLLAAQKHDYNWYLGDPPNDSINLRGGTHVSFMGDSATVRFFKTNADMGFGATLSDEAGNLIFYSNGCRIWNSMGEYMQGGEKINAGNTWEGYCPGINGFYPVWQPLMAIPWPGRPNKYFMLHLRKYLNTNPVAAPLDILYSVIDMDGDGGLGTVTARDQLLQNGVFLGSIAGTRHGNGRDWWLLVPSYDGKKFYRMLLTPEGIQGPYIQDTPAGTEAWSAGQIRFSPDGNWYVETIGKTEARLARFDRCSGLLYDIMPLTFEGDTLFASGATFSASSKMLYLSRYDKIFQYDLTASNIQASRQVVAEWNGVWYPIPTYFFQGILAPDEKIYLTSVNTVNVLHVIDHPDSLGLACGVRQQGLPLYTYHGFCVPNYPNYRLYDHPDSPCDSLNIDAPVNTITAPNPIREGTLHIYPNPARQDITISSTTPLDGAWQIVDIAGRPVITGRANPNQPLLQVSVSTLAAGTYYFVARQANGIPVHRTFVVIR